jgi:hypothetical protein
MVDKLRKTAPLVISHSDGEAPAASKLSAMNNQLRKSTNILEKAIGDLWNQSGDSIMVSYPLQLPNLARAIGEHKYMNPCLYPVDEDFIYVDNIGTKYENENEFYLQFKPKTLASIVINDAGSSALLTRKTNKYDVTTSGDYWVDSATGKVISFKQISSTAEIQYDVDSSTWNTRTETLPGIIPDPRQADYTGCRISQSGDNYYIHLPVRVPLTLDFDGGALDGFSLPDRYPPSTDFSDNYDTVIPGGTKKLWQSPVLSAALANSYYRYSLPKEIKDQLASLDVGATLPLGFLYLWDVSSGTIIADATFKKTADDWIFLIESSTVDFSGKVSSDESETSYNSTSYSIIAVGSPISRTIWTLSNSLMNHTHSNEGEFSSLMEHSKLIGLNPPMYSYSGHSSKYPSTVPAWSPSNWANDDHISLLSRVGSQGVAGTTERDVNDNAMLGSFLMASTVAIDGNYLNITSDSNRIYFGSIASGPYLFYDQSNDCIVGIHQSTNQTGFKGISTSGYGIEGLSPSGTGVYGSGGTVGVWGISTANWGIRGDSSTGTAVYGQSGSSYGIAGYTSYASGYVGYFWNDGDNANRYGIKVQCGADDGSGTTYYLRGFDGDDDAVGNIANTSGTFAVNDESDERLKKDIKLADDVKALDMILNLPLKKFKYKKNDFEHTGFIAQDVQAVYPNAVTADENGILAYSRDLLVPILIKAVQELKAEVELLKPKKRGRPKKR